MVNERSKSNPFYKSNPFFGDAPFQCPVLLFLLKLHVCSFPLSGPLNFSELLLNWQSTMAGANSPSFNWLEAPLFGKAYQLAKMRMTLQQAREYCESLGGRLLLPQSKEENDFICDNFKEVRFAVWLDVYGVLRRFNGRPIFYTNWSYDSNRSGPHARLCVASNLYRGIGIPTSASPLNYLFLAPFARRTFKMFSRNSVLKRSNWLRNFMPSKATLD